MKHFLISGGLGGLANGILKLAPENFRFLLLDKKENIPETFNGFKNYKHIAIDLADGDKLESVLHPYLDENKIKISGIVNTAAWHDFKNLSDTSYKNIRDAIDSKLISYINTIKSSLPYLEKGASIINIASVHAHATKDGFSAYSAANGGVISLTKALAVELRHKARVNTVTPGGFLTDEHKNFDKDWESKLEDGQVLKVEEVVNVVLFLLSDKSSGVNGAEILTEVGTSAMRAKSKDW